jgi:uncharacterized protein YndB with AHSA1/START domain
MPADESIIEPAADDEFLISRALEAAPAGVFRAWTEPSLMAGWWGPHTFTNPICEIDLRPGGAWRIVMRGPEGEEYPIKGIYRDIAIGERLVFTMDCSEHPAGWHEAVTAHGGRPSANAAGEMVSLVTFDPAGSGTSLTIRTRFETPAIREAMLAMGMTGGWSQSLDGLEKLLTSRERIGLE